MTDWRTQFFMRRERPATAASEIMIDELHDLVGLPFSTEPLLIARAADRLSEFLFTKALTGDRPAQQELVELEFAYRVWAYSKQ